MKKLLKIMLSTSLIFTGAQLSTACNKVVTKGEEIDNAKQFKDTQTLEEYFNRIDFSNFSTEEGNRFNIISSDKENKIKMKETIIKQLEFEILNQISATLMVTAKITNMEITDIDLNDRSQYKGSTHRKNCEHKEMNKSGKQNYIFWEGGTSQTTIKTMTVELKKTTGKDQTEKATQKFIDINLQILRGWTDCVKPYERLVYFSNFVNGVMSKEFAKYDQSNMPKQEILLTEVEQFLKGDEEDPNSGIPTKADNREYFGWDEIKTEIYDKEKGIVSINAKMHNHFGSYGRMELNKTFVLMFI